jgi:hypothetical protein
MYGKFVLNTKNMLLTMKRMSAMKAIVRYGNSSVGEDQDMEIG